MKTLSSAELARYVDHTLLKADATTRDFEKLCAEAREHRFYAVCVNGSRVERARHLLEDTDIKIACVVGFPLGAMESDVKRYETEAAIDDLSASDFNLRLGRLVELGDKLFVVAQVYEATVAMRGIVARCERENGDSQVTVAINRYRLLPRLSA